MKQTATLTDWSFHLWGDSYCLNGAVSGHPTAKDGERIRTSRLLRIDFEKGEAETLNTIYKLT